MGRICLLIDRMDGDGDRVELASSLLSQFMRGY